MGKKPIAAWAGLFVVGVTCLTGCECCRSGMCSRSNSAGANYNGSSMASKGYLPPAQGVPQGNGPAIANQGPGQVTDQVAQRNQNIYNQQTGYGNPQGNGVTPVSNNVYSSSGAQQPTSFSNQGVVPAGYSERSPQGWSGSQPYGGQSPAARQPLPGMTTDQPVQPTSMQSMPAMPTNANSANVQRNRFSSPQTLYENPTPPPVVSSPSIGTSYSAPQPTGPKVENVSGMEE